MADRGDITVKRLGDPKTAYPEHNNSAACWCEPVIIWRDPQTGDMIFVHRAWQ